METLTIGQLAKQAGVNVETVRYYERRSLLPEPPQTAAGYRQYSAEALRRIGFIRRAQELGFTLHEIGGLLALRVEPDTNCDAVEHQAEHAIARIEEKITQLERMRGTLRELAAACKARAPSSECPILEALEQEGGIS
jgi:MerR family mercuric resistance operon transcriptional regulator